MKTMFISLCLMLSLLTGFNLKAQEPCVINLIEAVPQPCDSTGFFYLEIFYEFAHTSDSFRLITNDQDWGHFAFSGNSVTIGPFPGDGQSEIKIVMSDSNDETCIDIEVFEPYLCEDIEPCSIVNLIVEPFECDSTGQYDLHVLVSAQNSSSSFEIQINGEPFGTYDYQDVPVQIGSFPGDGVTDLHIVVSDKEYESCQAEVQLEAITCNEHTCHIERIIAEAFHCDSIQMFDLYLDLEYGEVSDSFQVVINNESYGIYRYDSLPLRLGPFPGDGETNLNIFVSDLADSLCFANRIVESPLCEAEEPCVLTNLIVESGACDEEGRFSLLVFFQHQSLPEGLFRVRVNNSNLGTFNKDELPLQLEGLTPRDNRFQFIRICANGDESCCIEKEFLIPCCPEEENCSMQNGRYTIWCAEEGQYYVLLDFDLTGQHGDSVLIRGNGREYGTFAYLDRPILLGPFDRTGLPEPEFIITDTEDRECRVVIVPQDIECDNPTQLVYINVLDASIWSSGSFIEIMGDQLQGVNMKLYNLEGKQLAFQSLHSGHNRIPAGHLQKGIYLVSLEKSGQIYTSKLLLGR